MQVAVDGVGQPSFQTAQGFFVTLPGRAFALVIGLFDLGGQPEVGTVRRA